MPISFTCLFICIQCSTRKQVINPLLLAKLFQVTKRTTCVGESRSHKPSDAMTTNLSRGLRVCLMISGRAER